MRSITTEAGRVAPFGRCGVGQGLRRLLCGAALLALGLSGCASRYPMGAGTALAVDAMVVAAEQRRAAGGGSVPVGPYAATAEGRLDSTAEGEDADDE
ncbi:MAG: hypothetical protein F4X35_13270 [Alphaproteobacteria bacterium]|nr:hypothetical protein [Alphaproteobacteria bacterium]